MDLVQLLAAAPAWVRALVSVLAVLWALATAVTNALRAVPEARFAALEQSFPRLGHFLRAGRKIGSDLLPFVSALAAAMLGLPPRGAPLPRDARYSDDAMPPKVDPPAAP